MVQGSRELAAVSRRDTAPCRKCHRIASGAEHRLHRLPAVRIQCLAVVAAVLLDGLALERQAQAFVRHTVDDQELADVRTASREAAEIRRTLQAKTPRPHDEGGSA